MGDPNYSLSGVHNLSGLGKCRYHDTLSIRDEIRVLRFIGGYACLSFCGGKLLACSICRSLHLVVSRRGCGSCGDQAAIPRFICGGLVRACPGGCDCPNLRGDCVSIVRSVDPHQKLPGMNNLAGVDETLCDFSWNSESEVALDASCNNTRERSVHAVCGSYCCDLN